MLPMRRPLVVKGRREPLSAVPFHEDGPLERWLMASGPEIGLTVAVHHFTDVEPASRAYCQPHVHACDELNVFHTTTGLTVELLLGDETVLVEAPATVLIPAHLPHAANVVSGSGFLVVTLFDGAYRATRA